MQPDWLIFDTADVLGAFMKIVTAAGHVILADDSDARLLGGYSWYLVKGRGGRFYAHARVRGTKKRISMHRLLMSPPSDLVVHHKNNDGLDNRRSNLQITTQRVNVRYAHLGGKCVHQQEERWRAQPRDEMGKQVSLGMFDTEMQAKAAVSNWRYQKLLDFEALGESDLAEAFEQCLLAQN